MTSTLQAARESIGLTRLQPSSNLWTHVFGKSSSTLSSNTGTPLPPLGPIDKNATSTRVLLHDTQANLEKFSARIDALLNGFSEAKTEVKLVRTLFERDRETLMNDIIDLVNRCQTQIQKVVGSPAQSSILDNFSRDVNQRLENLDKRLDAIQTLSQTHAQSLQTQIQAVQSLHEQQCSVLAALMPLMPLLQAIPLHIDSAKNSLLDTIRTTRQSIPSHAKATQTSPVTYPCKDCGINKRPRATSLLDNLTTLTPRVNKRSRIDQGVVDVPSRPSKPTPVQNRTCLSTTPKLPKRSSGHNQPTSSSRNTVTFMCPQNQGSKPISRTNTGTRQNGSQNVPSQQHILTLGNCTNALRVVTTDSTNPLMKCASVTLDKSRHSIQKEPTVSLVPRSGEPTNPISTRKTEKTQTTSNSTIPVQQIQTINDFRRTSTQTTTANIVLAQGSQARQQLKYAMTSIPAKARQRRSPPVRGHDPLKYGLPTVLQKEGRRFIPLLDSDDEEIASP